MKENKSHNTPDPAIEDTDFTFAYWMASMPLTSPGMLKAKHPDENQSKAEQREHCASVLARKTCSQTAARSPTNFFFQPPITKLDGCPLPRAPRM
ncbi:hypothetical protein CBR_g8577 [Chara braunii]|uniref:Uncharacterized protein n=1 Tax=Chara braunii TaxID=69332 RepID=A0A388JRW4_CHABU|nr:hypothetical protein CBR_g8577 [Chara braunii]|eukprot:GBG60554.1 hypothetical protein CBR_g8577 [Chara braunii]